MIVHATNRFSFTDLSDVTTTWRLLSAGKELKTGDEHLPLARRKSGDLKLDLPGDALLQADVLRLEFTITDGRNLATYDLRLKPEADTAENRDE